MTENLLDNPIWGALATEQSALALGNVHARRYPSNIAPFGAVAASTPEAEKELIQLVEPGEKICVVGVAPPLSAAWKLEKQGKILQMICAERLEEVAASDIKLLTSVDVTAMMELTELVYPAYFRAGVAELGEYFGIYQAGQLAAMAGERMSLTGHREISAVCTHPDFLGRGYAQRLVTLLVNKILARSETPFLHVDVNNTRAIALYERLQFKSRCTLPLWLIQRQP